MVIIRWNNATTIIRWKITICQPWNHWWPFPCWHQATEAAEKKPFILRPWQRASNAWWVMVGPWIRQKPPMFDGKSPAIYVILMDGYLNQWQIHMNHQQFDGFVGFPLVVCGNHWLVLHCWWLTRSETLGADGHYHVAMLGIEPLRYVQVCFPSGSLAAHHACGTLRALQPWRAASKPLNQPLAPMQSFHAILRTALYSTPLVDSWWSCLVVIVDDCYCLMVANMPSTTELAVTVMITSGETSLLPNQRLPSSKPSLKVKLPLFNWQTS